MNAITHPPRNQVKQKMLSIAFDSLLLGRFDPAETICRALALLDPHTMPPRLGLSLLYQLRGGGETGESLQALERAFPEDKALFAALFACIQIASDNRRGAYRTLQNLQKSESEPLSILIQSLLENELGEYHGCADAVVT